MARLVIRGRNRLKGKVRIGGSKNSSVAIIPAVLLGKASLPWRTYLLYVM